MQIMIVKNLYQLIKNQWPGLFMGQFGPIFLGCLPNRPIQAEIDRKMEVSNAIIV